MLRAHFEAITGRWLPLVVFLFFFSATTVVGSLYFMTDRGPGDLEGFVQGAHPAVRAMIGSPTYLAVVLLPFLLTPIGAMLGHRSMRFILSQFNGDRPFAEPPIYRPVAFAVLLSAVAFCIFRLYQADALLPAPLDYRSNILRRTELFDELGSAFFILAYGVIPIMCCLFLISFEKRGRKAIDLIGFAFAFLFFYFVIFNTYSKSHLLVFSIMLVCAILLSRISWWYIPGIVLISACAFMLAWSLLDGKGTITRRPNPPMTIQAPTVDNPNAPSSAAAPSISTGPKEPALPAPAPHKANFVIDTIQPLFFRMASAVPFYIAIFNDPNERCGIEAHTVRRVLHLPASSCTIPTKVFSRIYPQINWVTGYSPAAAPVSAYGELGLVWAISVMLLSGILLGALGGIIELSNGPLVTGIGVAACTFAYYLSQLPVVGAITYGHGLVFISLPVILIYLASATYKRLNSRMDRGSEPLPRETTHAP